MMMLFAVRCSLFLAPRSSSSKKHRSTNKQSKDFFVICYFVSRYALQSFHFHFLLLALNSLSILSPQLKHEGSILVF